MRHARKLNNWFWWIVALFPLLFALIYMFSAWQGAQTLEMTAVLTELNNLLPSVGIVTDALNTLANYFGTNMSTVPFVKMFNEYMGYFTLVQILHIAVDVLLMLPKLCNHLFHGKKDNEV